MLGVGISMLVGRLNLDQVEKRTPIMRVVAGPPGAGKSVAFPVKEAGLDYFDADARAAELNGGSHIAIPQYIRSIVNQEFEAFIEDHIAKRRSLTFETTLRSTITFEQAKRARQAGFNLRMTYVALDSVALHIERVAVRADQGGHSAPPSVIEQIHSASLLNFRRALVEFDSVAVYDNSGGYPELVLTCNRGRLNFLRLPLPDWIQDAVLATELEGER